MVSIVIPVGKGSDVQGEVASTASKLACVAGVNGKEVGGEKLPPPTPLRLTPATQATLKCVQS